MSLRLRLAVLVFTSACLAAPIVAQNANAGATPTRIAVVDVQKVLTQSNAGKAAYDKLKKLQDGHMETAKKMDEELKKLDQEINANRTKWKEDYLMEAQKRMADKRIALQRYTQDAEQQIAKARDQELVALESQIKPIIDQIGAEMGLAAIFNKFESGLVYASDKIDITDTIVRRFNEAKR